MPTSTSTNTPPPLSKTTSDCIKVARVLCILGVIYVHMPPYTSIHPDHILGVDGLLWLIRQVIGLSSVPLLSIVSGFLLVRLTRDRTWRSHIHTKVITLVVPLALWNAIALLKDVLQSGGQEIPAWPMLAQNLIAITGYPRLTPLYFLRDVFICNLLAHFVQLAIRRHLRVTLAFLLLNSLFNLDGHLLTNSAILLFFSIGIALAQGRLHAPWLAQHRLATSALAAITLVFAVLRPSYGALVLHGPTYDALVQDVVSLAHRFAGATLFWIASDAIARLSIAARIIAFEPVIFFVFCAHPLIIGALWLILQAAGTDVGGPAHVLFFIFGPLLVLAVSTMAVAILAESAPAHLRVLMGGRAPTRAHLKAMLHSLIPG